MSAQHNRRAFLADVGRGALTASLGGGLAADLGLATARAADEPTGPQRLTFGPAEPLVALLQGTSADRLVSVVAEKLETGTPLRDLVAAAALANARTFGGEDYVGFHTMMALAPALHMADDLPSGRQPLPVIKVLYRNARRIQESGGGSREVLRAVEPLCCLPDDRPGGEVLRAAVRARDMTSAESTFALLAQARPEDAFNDLLFAVYDNTEVHRTVLPYRAWDLLGLIGTERAHTLLRQSVRYCVKSERDWRHTAETDRPRVVLPRLLDEYKLLGRPLGTRLADDAWVDRMSQTLFKSSPDQAAEAAAAALAEGMSPAAVGEALSLAANQLILRDAGRRPRDVQPNKPLGSVHGDSIGVHACDSANAWRNMARASNPRNTVACLILGAFQVAYDRVERGGDFLSWGPRPLPDDVDAVRSVQEDAMLPELESAIRSKDQSRATALAQRLGETGEHHQAVFDLLLGFAVSEDGALHAEKFYRTVREEFAATRVAFRGRQIVALARVTASEYGQPAPGYAEACARLGV